MASDLPVSVFEIKEYMVIFRQLEEDNFNGVTARIRGIIRCTGTGLNNDDEYRLDVYFLAPDSEVPQPVVDLDNKRGAIFLPIADMSTIIDVMRNEKPLFGHLRGDNPQWTSITTTNEPVGTGDEDFG